MGLTGFLTSATIQMLPIETDKVLVDTERFADLDGVMTAMKERDHLYKYSVAWVDCMTRGAHMGRAILTRASHATASDLDQVTLKAPKPTKLFVPFDAPSGLLNALSVRAFNELWFRSAPSSRRTRPRNCHVLSPARRRTRLEPPLRQARFRPVPVLRARGRTRDDRQGHRPTLVLGRGELPRGLEALRTREPGSVVVSMPGWTLALDCRSDRATARSPRRFGRLVLEANGRIYFAKDARLAPEKVRAMYPRLDEFLEVKSRVDPRHQMASDLARRLQLVGK